MAVSLKQLVVLTSLITTISSLDNGVGLYPGMGWVSWSAFGCEINDTVIRETADKMSELKLNEYGYTYINLDDCWQGGRYSNGSVYANKTTFDSSGSLASLSAYIRSKGFKFGLYTSRGTHTCEGKTASLGHEYQDAQTYRSWGVEYVKEDTCGQSNDVTQATCFAEYAKMRDALNQTSENGKYPPVYFSLCGNEEWYGPAGASLGNSWRIAADDDVSWSNVLKAIDTEAQYNLHQYSGPGAWNDPDMLVANGPHHVFSEQESRFQFSVWSVLMAPLLLSFDVRAISSYNLATYTNKYVIGVDQDKLRSQGIRVSGSNMALNNGNSQTNVWSRLLVDGSRAMVFMNVGHDSQDVSCDSGCFQKAGFFNVSVQVFDYWNDMKFVANHSTAQTFTAKGLPGSSGFAMYKMTPYYNEQNIPRPKRDL